MPERTILQYQCTQCKRQEYVDPLEPATQLDWLVVYSELLSTGTGVQNVYCNFCRDNVLQVLGYADYKTYLSVVKVNSQIELSSDSDSVENVPFYLLDEESN